MNTTMQLTRILRKKIGKRKVVRCSKARDYLCPTFLDTGTRSAQPRELGHGQNNPELVEYKPEHEVPDDAIAVATPDGRTIYDEYSPTKKANGAAPRQFS